MHANNRIIKTTPKPSQICYKLYFALSFVRYPLRAFNLLRSKLSRFNPRLRHLPVIIDIEPTQRCNLRCAMCMPFAKSNENLSFNSFKQIVDEQYGLIEVKIQGVGEPLLNPDFFKMIHYARKKMLWVRTTTNGTLLHINENYKLLVDSGVHDINISIDGCSRESYLSIRIGADFNRIKENCRLINDYNNTLNKTTVRAWVVLQKKNKHEFFDFPGFFASLGFKEMTYSFALHNYGRKGQNTEYTDFDLSEDDFKKVKELGERAGIKITFFFHPFFKGDFFCKIPFNRIYVTTDQHILPCCYVANPEVVNFGNYADFEDIWFNKYIKFRSELKKKEYIPDFCGQCHGKEI